jgi:hypothetical protein
VMPGLRIFHKTKYESNVTHQMKWFNVSLNHFTI